MRSRVIVSEILAQALSEIRTATEIVAQKLDRNLEKKRFSKKKKKYEQRVKTLKQLLSKR